MRISVVLPTNRPAGPIFGIYGLSKQTFPQEDFELIIVDDYHRDRSDLIADTSKLLGLENVLILKSKPHYWRSNRLISNARNTALIHAKGELVVFLDDYCWIRPHWLDEHWKTYRKGYCMLGGIQIVKYVPYRFDNLDELPPPSVKEVKVDHETLMKREGERGTDSAFIQNLRLFKVADTRGPNDVRRCSGGWFYTCNASAPMDKLAEVNGFDEEFDLTSEEDIDLGLRLTRAGCKFWYRRDPDCTAYHMDHTEIDREMKKGPKRYGEVIYQNLRDRGVIESGPDEVQLVLKEKYGTKYDGSWGLHEHRKITGYALANIVDGERIFDLRMERWKLKKGTK